MNKHRLVIYIAGKITGEPLEECMGKFAKAEQQLRNIGANPVNPFKLGISKTATRMEAMPHCLKALSQCDAIYLLQDHEVSIGATMKYLEAKRLRLDIFYEKADGIKDISEHVKINMVG